ncbi:MAG: hypothetical protein ACRC8S_15015 [Fimbriiglobus sp.]
MVMHHPSNSPRDEFADDPFFIAYCKATEPPPMPAHLNSHAYFLDIVEKSKIQPKVKPKKTNARKFVAISATIAAAIILAGGLLPLIPHRKQPSVTVPTQSVKSSPVVEMALRTKIERNEIVPDKQPGTLSPPTGEFTDGALITFRVSSPCKKAVLYQLDAENTQRLQTFISGDNGAISATSYRCNFTESVGHNGFLVLILYDDENAGAVESLGSWITEAQRDAMQQNAKLPNAEALIRETILEALETGDWKGRTEDVQLLQILKFSQ